MLLDKKVLSPELADELYGSRLQKLVNNPYVVNMGQREPHPPGGTSSSCGRPWRNSGKRTTADLTFLPAILGSGLSSDNRCATDLRQMKCHAVTPCLP
jgi:hypothetical protein